MPPFPPTIDVSSSPRVGVRWTPRVRSSPRADLAAQTRQAMRNLEAALHAAGAGLDDVVKTTVYVAASQRDDLVAAWQAIRERFGDHDAPSTLLGVTMLGYQDQLVEIEAVASVPDLRVHS